MTQWKIQNTMYDRDGGGLYVNQARDATSEEVHDLLTQYTEDPKSIIEQSQEHEFLTLVVTKLQGTDMPTVHTVGIAEKALETPNEMLDFFSDHPILGKKRVLN